MYNVRRTGRNNLSQDLVSVDTVRKIVKEFTNPIPEKKVIEGDGLAFRSYFYNIHHQNKK